MLPVAAIARTYEQALSGTPTAPPIPIKDIDYASIWVACSAAFTVRYSASDPGFPLAANIVYSLPIQQSCTPLFSGSGTLSLMPLGYGAMPTRLP